MLTGKKRTYNVDRFVLSPQSEPESLERSSKRRKLQDDAYISKKDFTFHFQLDFDNTKIDTIMNFRLLEQGNPEINLDNILGDVKKLKIRDFGFGNKMSEMLVDSLDWNSSVLAKFNIKPINEEESKSIPKIVQQFLRPGKKIAIAPIKNTDYQFIIYLVTSYEGKFWLQSQLIKKFELVLDLDNTLILSHVEKIGEEDENVNKDCVLLEKFWKAFGVKVYTKVKNENIIPFLKWSSKVFKITVCTNSLYHYAKECLLSILDPERKTLLKGINNDVQLKAMLKSRDDLVKMNYACPNTNRTIEIRVKDLEFLNIGQGNNCGTVIFDDKTEVWPRNEINVLPFHEMNTLGNMKDCIWKKITTLHLLRSCQKLSE